MKCIKNKKNDNIYLRTHFGPEETKEDEQQKAILLRCKKEKLNRDLRKQIEVKCNL